MSDTDREYVLKCQLKFHRKWVQDDTRRYERELVILVPVPSDEVNRFFDAWMPESSQEYFELNSLVAPPVDSPCRLSIHKGPDDKHHGPYLFVMSKGVEEILLNYKKEGDEILLTVLPEDADDELMDQMRDSTGNYKLVHGQESM